MFAICGGTLPAWTYTLVYSARFLFPFSLRRAWFRATALGQPRALHALRAAAAAEGGLGGDPTDRNDDRASNVGRLTRQKVCHAPCDSVTVRPAAFQSGSLADLHGLIMLTWS